METDLIFGNEASDMLTGNGAADVQIAAAPSNEAPYDDALPQPLDAAQVVVPQGENVVREPVTPGEVVELPFPADSQFLARIDNGNLAIKVGDVTIILQGYVEAAGQAAPVIEASNGQPLDIATILASTDPNIDIQTAAGPAAGPQGQGADNTGGILQQLGAGAGLGGFEGAGAQDGTDGLGGGTVDQTGTLFKLFGLVTPDNAPLALDDAYTTNEDTVLNIVAPGVLGNDSDPDGDPLTAALLTGPAHGTLAVNADGSFTYTPDKDYNGADSFTYQADDGKGGVTPATVNITVNPVNDAPVAVNDSYTTDEDTPLTVTVANSVLNNDTDVDGDPLTAALLTAPAHGTLAFNADGSFTYTPDKDYHGPDSFTYQADDGNGGVTPATVNITVNSVNDAPVTVNDTYTTNEDTPLTVTVANSVLNNDTDVDGDPLTAALLTAPAHGTLAFNADGTFTYTPDKDYNGPDSFTYQADDGNGGVTPATVSITVNPVNDAPEYAGGQDSYALPEDTSKANAQLNWIITDVDDPAGPFTVTVKDPGSLPPGVTYKASTETFTIDAKGNYDYLAAGESATFTITMKITDPHGAVTDKDFTLTINGTNDPVTAVNDVVLVDGGSTSVLLPVWMLGANDTDPEADGHVSNVNGINLNGSETGLAFLPAVGDVTVPYTVSDASTSSNGTVTFKHDAIGDSIIDGTNANEILVGTVGHETLNGGGGNDVIAGGGGGDEIFGGAGDDTLVFSSDAGTKIHGETDSVTLDGGLTAARGNHGDVLAFSDTKLDFSDHASVANIDGIETISMQAKLGGFGAQSLTIGAHSVQDLSDHTITPGGIFTSDKDAVRIDGDAVDSLYLSVSKDGGQWADTGVVANGYHIFAHETTGGDPTTTDAYVAVSTTVPTANVHLNADAP